MVLLNLLTWRSIIEIFVISTCIYRALWWLATDKTKTVIFYFYYYAVAFFISFFCNLFTLADFLLLLSPVFMILLVIMHSDTLQRSLVPLKKIIPPIGADNARWIDELVRTCLLLRNKGVECTVVIENADSLTSFIDINCPINTLANQKLLEILLPIDQNAFTLLTQSGTIIGVACKWKTDDHPAYSAKFDCIILRSEAKGFSVECQNKIIEELTAPQVNTILKHTVSSRAVADKGENNARFDTIYKKSIQQQSHS